MNEKNELIIYRSKSGEVEIETRLENETLWLSQEQMAGLFDVNRQAISKHLINIFKTKELIHVNRVTHHAWRFLQAPVGWPVEHGPRHEMFLQDFRFVVSGFICYLIAHPGIYFHIINGCQDSPDFHFLFLKGNQGSPDFYKAEIDWYRDCPNFRPSLYFFGRRLGRPQSQQSCD